MKREIKLRDARESEYRLIGNLMAEVYSRLEGFPTPDEQPNYYQMLRNVGELTRSPGTTLIVAVDETDRVQGAVVYIREMCYYGSGGSAVNEREAAGFRLLTVDPECRRRGIGRALTLECIRRARSDNRREVIIHTTEAMQIAWEMYEAIGFRRSVDLDFMQQTLPVFGFRYPLPPKGD